MTGSNKDSSIIRKDQWWDVLSRLIDVVHMNIFIIDSQGRVILPPDVSRYGGSFLSDSSLGFDLISGQPDFIKSFHRQGTFWESHNRYDLRMYMLPLHYQKNVVANVVIGPVILSKRLDQDEYVRMAHQYQANPDVVIDQLSEIRVVSNVMMNSILELLDEVVKNNMQILDKYHSLNVQIDNLAKEINASVRQDEILLTLLDVALKMTGTECGSIMVFDPHAKSELILRVSKGLDESSVKNVRVKLGEGLTGLAAQKDEYFVINGAGDHPHNHRISHLLKRPEIRESLVMPLKAQNKIFGVLNLHTKRGESRIQENLINIQYLSDLVSSAF